MATNTKKRTRKKTPKAAAAAATPASSSTQASAARKSPPAAATSPSLEMLATAALNDLRKNPQSHRSGTVEFVRQLSNAAALRLRDHENYQQQKKLV